MLALMHVLAQVMRFVQVKTKYYPEVVELIKRMTGGSRVSVMMHAIRKGKIERG